MPALVLAQGWPTITQTTNIPRFQMVAEGLYRGGQPDLTGFEFLKKQGIKTVINLRTENDEEAIIKKLGMNYVQISVSVTPFTGSKIPDKAIAKYFEIINNPDNYPIFFHCKRGADRTGAMAGFYRIVHQGWDGDKAYSEARKVGMRWWYPGLKGQLKDFKETWTTLQAAPAGASK